MRAVFLDRSTIDQSIDFSSLSKQVDELVSYATTSFEDIIERAINFDILITNKVILNESILSKLPHLKLICITATGMNNVDLKAAEKLNIKITNVAGYSTSSVTQHVFAYLLSLTNRVSDHENLNDEKPWSESELFCQFAHPVRELAGLTLGIVGFGELGKSVAHVAVSFGMNVLISERSNADKIRQNRIQFEQMLSESDIVSLHCPLTERTNSLFDRAVFEKMKQGSVLINTARGQIVNSNDLASALRSGKLSHAIIDVLETEPPESDHPLLQNDVPNLTLTHHIAWGSLKAQQRLIDSVAENIRKFNKLF